MHSIVVVCPRRGKAEAHSAVLAATSYRKHALEIGIRHANYGEEPEVKLLIVIVLALAVLGLFVLTVMTPGQRRPS